MLLRDREVTLVDFVNHGGQATLEGVARPPPDVEIRTRSIN